ncbi:MAG: energy-coupling factor ABC transporter ATP-binding protein [Treponema sp.]|jgi:cobalt/nickel transport system ATP-binding protein|nr:energy-coupling factor ABC transporter ATP-binding protein [Treponema sp.]
MTGTEGLTVRYEKDAPPALEGVTFSAAPGERVALLGRNGAGKSTLLLALAGVVPPAAGRAFVDGIPVDRKHLDQVRRALGFVFQNPDDNLFMPTVAEDIAFGPRNFQVDEKTIAEKTASVAARLGITPLLERPTGRLSWGEKRLAALAGALVMDCRVLLLDEPCAFLDAPSRRALASALAALPQTLLIATHDLALARALCPRALILRDGRIAASGETGALLSDEALLAGCGL